MASTKPVTHANTLEVRDRCICLHLQRTARTVARLFDEALKPAGLTNGQFSLLMSLNRPEPANMGQISGLLGMDRTTLTATLKPLQRHGWIRVVADTQDRRVRRVSLTASGLRVLAMALPLWKRTQRRMEKKVRSGADWLRAELKMISDIPGRQDDSIDRQINVR